MHHHHRPALLLATLLCAATLGTHALPAEDVPAGAQIQEDTAGQVTINDDPTSNTTETNLPITATIFAGVPGPYHCRGSVMLKLDIPPPPLSADGTPTLTAPQCVDMPSPAGCANFVANKADGCEARLFAEPKCRMYMNTAVFIPEERAFGGLWRSLEVRCGIPPPDPETLGQVPFADLLKGAKRRPKGSR
ncbi:hypothetical protein B0T16DRAFT_331990 [Cercophora newfieldiana]|uniref:Uncharacterized protein n=1 Tax=Cercophora newfieldiana TaxID=92897 RepID=A0AA40CN55_9PEZI|nr:hypothetical protein B0T16DRAFT_331990 [Cercophora newfieldiana]